MSKDSLVTSLNSNNCIFPSDSSLTPKYCRFEIFYFVHQNSEWLPSITQELQIQSINDRSIKKTTWIPKNAGEQGLHRIHYKEIAKVTWLLKQEIRTEDEKQENAEKQR